MTSLVAHASLTVVATAGGLVPEAAARVPRRAVQPSASGSAAAKSHVRRPVMVRAASAAAERMMTAASCSYGGVVMRGELGVGLVGGGGGGGGSRRWTAAGTSSGSGGASRRRPDSADD